MITYVVVLGLAAAPAVVVAPDDYSIAALKFEIPKDAVLGPLRAGLLCLPAGRTRWKDVALPENATAVASLNRTLAAENLAVETAGDPIFAEPPPPTRYRLRVTVVSATLRLCKPGSPVGPQTYKGAGTLTVVWETFDRHVRSSVVSNQFTVPLVIEKSDPKRDADAVLEALAQSARLYARTRRSRSTDRPPRAAVSRNQD